ncbi:ADP-ribosylglycohydrolase [Saccharopolyspora kobensis]|uniref:ADP-ribosylglycohydrolase n=1 Tax=Saccharopolyspora kobensis TaxID=146035 RepID=A0A1H6E5N2_9PSEU|nr:type VII secretion system-associated protein [Saccharopolyspora kobensis]SEG92947.1 ADP-ribosylglycohydrolase [Saccharopolyspora kobensis]SFD41545.1 ADP-ribosylglycohydrolase [Saccharopolyspora kobensis]
MNTTQQPNRPVITPAMREQATKQPNTWLYVVDPIFTDPNAEVPPWGFIGGYRVDEQGEITDDFSPNPNYRPSPVALRLPAPTNDVERALQLTTTGYAQGHALLTAMLDAELILFAQPQGTGLFTMEHESGRRQLQVFTSENFLPPNWTSWQRMTGRQLAGHNPAGIDIQVNPTSPVKARLPAEDLIKAAAAVPPKPGGAPVPSPATGTPVIAPPSPPTGTPVPPGAAAAPVEPPAPTAIDPTETEFGRRFIGSVLAGAIGDALGAPVEFYPVDQIRSRFGAMGVTEYDRTGDQPGEFTDDTQMALFTLEGLIRGHIAVRAGASSPLSAIQLAYQRWLHTQGYAWMRAAGPFAISHPKPNGWLVEQHDLFAVRSPNSSCITALREFASVGAPGTFERPINDSPDCGGVVRAAPVALWAEDPKQVFELAAATAALTYSQPNGYLPAGVLAVIVHQLLREATLEDAVRHARELLVQYADHEDTDRALQAAEDLAQQGKPSPEQLKDTLGGGWAGHEALAIAVCAALSTDSIAAALMVAVNHSGDSDSTGAICGNIVGARYGAPALPGVWLRDLKQREIVETLAKDALLEFGPTPPSGDAWTARYPAAKDVSDLEFASALPLASEKAAAEPAAPVAEPAEPAAAAEESPVDEETTSISEEQLAAVAESIAAAPAAEEPAVAEEPAADPVAEEESEPVADEEPAAETVAETAPEPEIADEPSAEQDAPAVDPAELHAQRIFGFLLGGAAGDALGYPIEDDSLQDIRRKYGSGGLTDFVDAHRPGGSVSDETQMTLFTLEGLIRASIRRRLFGENEPATQVQHAYQRWLHTQGFDWKEAGGPLATTPPDGWLIRQKGLFVRRAPGTTCIQALHGYANGKPQGSFSNRLNDSKGCGGVMRAAPAALWSSDPTEVFQVGAMTAVLTHGNPSGYLPAGALAVIVQQLLDGRSLPEAVDGALTQLSTWDGHEETSAALRAAVELAAGDPSPEQLQEVLGDGWFGEQALAIAVCAALAHPQSFADAVVLAANHSGDSDSTAAICGNIMGAALTAEAIPQTWRDKLELREVIEQLATDAIREFGPNPPRDADWLDRYPIGTAEPAVAEPAPAEPAVAEAVVAEPAPAEPAVAEPAPAEPAVAEPAPAEPAVAEPAPAEEPALAPVEEHVVAEPEPETVAEQPAPAEPAPDPVPEPPAAEPVDDADDGLSDEELRLLMAWRKFRDNEDGTSADLTQDLHKLLVEAFGPERAAQLIGEATEIGDEPELVAETQVQLGRDERLAGCVLGTAVGDALGAPWMFADLSTILRENPEGVRTMAEAFGTRAAATAHGQQTAFVLEGLIRSRIRSVLRGVSAHWPSMVRGTLLHWMHTQGVKLRSGVFQLGVLAETEVLHAQRFPDEATLTALARSSDRREVPTPSNPPNSARTAAAAVRGAAVGFEFTSPQDAIIHGAEIAAVTHGHPDGYLSAGALAGLVCSLNNGQTLIDAVHSVLAELDQMEVAEGITQGLRSAIEIVGSGPVSPTRFEELGLGWHAPEALAIAVASALAHPNSFADAVSLAATHSGNTAASAAICGSLLGAARGTEQIPADWLEELELREVLTQLITDEQRARTEIFTDQPVPDWAQRYLG